jgi:hypothetical protein
MRRVIRAGALLGILISITASVHAQSGVQVELDEVTDNRVTAGPWKGSLELRVNVKGAAADKASAARIIVNDARDDRGTALSKDSTKPDFMSRQVNSGTLQFSIGTPARSANAVKIKGSVELYVPARDPASVVTIDKALSKLDAPLSAKPLQAAKIAITPLSPAAYAAARKARKLDDQKVAELRAEGKRRGASDAEIEQAVGLAKAFESMDEELPPGTVILSGAKADFDRIFLVEIIGTDGNPIDIRGRSVSSTGDLPSLMTIQPAEPPPANASLRLSLLTAKSLVTSPFELSVSLP